MKLLIRSLTLIQLLFSLTIVQGQNWKSGTSEEGKMVVFTNLSQDEFKKIPLYLDGKSVAVPYQKGALPFFFLKNIDGSYDLFRFFSLKEGEIVLNDLQKVEEKKSLEMVQKFKEKRKRHPKTRQNWGFDGKPYFWVFLGATLVAQYAYENAVNDHQNATTQNKVDSTHKRVLALYDTRNILAGSTAGTFFMRF